MTSIIGINSAYQTWLGGDSAATDDDSIEVRVESKVWQRGRWVFGSCPSFRLIQVIKFKLNIDTWLNEPSKTTTQDIVNNLVLPLRNLINDMRVDIEDGWTILLGGSGKLWSIQDDYSVSQVIRYTAIGSGSQYALGVLHYVYEGQSSNLPVVPSHVYTYQDSLECKHNLAEYVIIKAASRAAGAYCISVSPPYIIVKA